MAKFRHIGPGGYVAIGFPAFTGVETDSVIDVSDDDEAVRAYNIVYENGHEIHRPAQTTADCYRGQPDMWEEIVDFVAPPVVAAPVESESEE